MTRPRSMTELVAAAEPVRVQGEFLRHAAPNRDAFAGGYGGRWGESFRVIYLGRPDDSCVGEAYRHLVDDAGVPASLVGPRVVYRTRIDISSVLDLRMESTQELLGLSRRDLMSNVGDYETCQRVAAAAHQLELHGVIAPAATGLGETLAVFKERVGLSELPEILETKSWARLPARPGSGTHLTVVSSS